MSLSRALSDSEIDYDFYKKYRYYPYSYTWEYWRDPVYTYTSDYLTSPYRYLYLDTDVDEVLLNRDLRYATELAERRRWYDEERRRLQRRLDEKYYLYSPGDPTRLELQDALRSLDMKIYRLKNLEDDLASIRPRLRSRLAMNRLRSTLYDMYWW